MRFNKNSLAVAVAVIMSLTPLSVLAVPTLSTSTVQSQGLNVEISPLPVMLEVKPGATATTDLRIRNGGAQSEKLKVSLKTFTTEGADGHVVLHNPAPNDDSVKWVSFSQNIFDAPPGQWQTIKMTVSPPKTAAYGYYYAVQFELANPPKSQPGAARLQGAVVIFVLLDVNAPGATKKIEVSSFKADHSSYEFLPANFTVQVHNSGNIHTAPSGNIFIKRGSHQVAVLQVNSANGMVLPGSNRIFTTAWNDGFPHYVTKNDASGQPVKDKTGNAEKTLTWDFSKVSKLRFGHYTAQLLLVYNDGQRDVPITGSLSFWIIPWRLILLAILIIAAPALLVYLVMRWRIRKKLPQKAGDKHA